MLYIFDGENLTGKTSIAKEFAHKLNIPYIKKDLSVLKYQNREILKKDNIELIQKFFWSTIYPVGIKYDIVIDRSILSSLAYSIIFNRKEDLGYIYALLKLENIDKFIKIFFIKTDKESLIQRYNDRGENLFSIDEIYNNQKVFEKVVKHITDTFNKFIITTVQNNNGDSINSITNSLINIYGKIK